MRVEMPINVNTAVGLSNVNINIGDRGGVVAGGSTRGC